ncbi:MAG: hypothetical protein Q7R98_03160 [Candidatus Jorgensenbacteria bacterium]|nr:hypothetical protein [Candidatus Jorgensenbacteria bacterium]
MAFEQILGGKNIKKENKGKASNIPSEKEKNEALILDLDERMLRESPIYRKLSPEERSKYLKELIDLYFKEAA